MLHVGDSSEKSDEISNHSNVSQLCSSQSDTSGGSSPDINVLKLTQTCKINNTDVYVTAYKGSTYLSCKEVFSAMGIADHVKNECYRFIDKYFQKASMRKEVLFLTKGQRRKFVKLEAILHLVKKKKNYFKVPNELIRRDLDNIFVANFNQSLQSLEPNAASTPKVRKRSLKKSPAPKGTQNEA